MFRLSWLPLSIHTAPPSKRACRSSSRNSSTVAAQSEKWGTQIEGTKTEGHGTEAAKAFCGVAGSCWLPKKEQLAIPWYAVGFLRLTGLAQATKNELHLLLQRTLINTSQGAQRGNSLSPGSATSLAHLFRSPLYPARLPAAPLSRLRPPIGLAHRLPPAHPPAPRTAVPFAGRRAGHRLHREGRHGDD